uniref:Uncharacterized protein n=1 Tax=Tetranychus urticae TaxID=32264 RepID=T1KV93_TETUR
MYENTYVPIEYSFKPWAELPVATDMAYICNVYIPKLCNLRQAIFTKTLKITDKVGDIGYSSRAIFVSDESSAISKEIRDESYFEYFGQRKLLCSTDALDFMHFWLQEECFLLIR